MLKQFYEKALPSQGVYCVCGIDPNTGRISSRFAETLDDVFNHIETLRPKKLNIYVTPASYENWSRKAENCLFVRSFFLDIDTHGKDAYGTKEETIQALDYLVEVTGLPKPVYIDSGGGVHAYWIMDRDIPYVEWKDIAEKFKSLCQKHIKIDLSVTADAARLMRCPDTINYRYDPVRTATIISEAINVYDFDEFKEFLATEILEIVDPTPLNLSSDVFANVHKGLDEDTLAMKKLDNFEWDFEKLADRSVEGDGCAQVAYWVQNLDTLGYEDWFSSMNIAYFCKDGNKWIHDLSKPHPLYTYESVEKKRLEYEKLGKPQTCKHLENQAPDRCKGCKHYGKINTPIVLGKTLKAATEEIPIEINPTQPIRQTQNTKTIPVFPDFLEPFSRGESGGVYYQPPPSTDKQGKVTTKGPVEILAHVLYPTRRLFSQLDGECMTMNLVLPHDGLKEFLLPMKSVVVEVELKKLLAYHQVIYPAKYLNEIRDYLIKWSQYMINVGKAYDMRMQLGWTALKDNKEEWKNRSFVLGGTEINTYGEEIDSPYSPYIKSIIKYIKPMGTLEKWQECANELNRPGFELHAMACLSGFGSPLMSYMTTPGVVISLLGRSGAGKTAALYSGLSVFGDPVGLSVFDSTDMGLTQRMLACKNIMYGIDEVGNKDPKPLSQLTHNVSNGKAKIRLQASVNAEREHEQSASLITFLTTNESIYNKFEVLKGSPDGEAARCIEFVLEQPDDLKGADGARLGKLIFNPFKSNYGHAGPLFIKKILELGDDYIDARILYWSNKYLEDTAGDSVYRFHENYVAAIMTAGEIVVEMGLVKYDLDRIYKKIIKDLNHIKLNVLKINNTDYAGILNDFMYENMGNILRIKDNKVTDEPRGKLVARVATDEPTRVSKEVFKEYLTKKKISPREFEKYMMESGDMIDKSAKKHLETGWKPTTTTKAGYVYLFKNTIDVTAESDN